MISQLAMKHADKCRFCWMCRHLCPVQLVTGREINTPRAKALLLSMNHRGKKFDADEAQAMYECLLCDACCDNCATGYQPTLFIREARTEAVVQDLAPEAVMRLIENSEKSGNIFGKKKPFLRADEKADVLLYVGEAAWFGPLQMAKAVLSLIRKAGQSCMILPEEPASGMMLGDLMGYVEEVREQAVACARALNESGAATIIILDSYDAEIMRQKYPEWGCALNANIVTATEYIAGLLRNGRLTIDEKQLGVAAVHDDDRSARAFHEFEPVREIARSVGYELVEMFNHRELAKSCGTTVTKAYMPEIVQKTAEGRWNDFARTNAQIMLTANPQAYECLSETVPEGAHLVDLFEMLDSVCDS